MKNWRHRAFCRGANPEIFDDGFDVNTAKAYCLRCPVTVECLDDAVAKNDEGVRGGTTYDERTALKRGGHRASCPGCGAKNVFNDGSSEVCVGCGLSWRV